MSKAVENGVTVSTIGRLVLVTPDLVATTSFFRDALGFHPEGEAASAPPELLLGMPGARATRCLLRLGEQRLELVQYDQPGCPYPEAVGGNDGRFQHFAMITRDMAAAMARLRGVAGWTPISQDGPQRLPPDSGGVLAFKFRDPDGHPLEFLEFPSGTTGWDAVPGDGLLLGIDHTAISVADARRSENFYVHGLGFHAASRSLNEGAAQERLDGLPAPRLDVVGLNPAGPVPPHLELLGYHTPAPHAAPRPALFDVAATRTVLHGSDTTTLLDRLRKSGAAVNEVARDPASGAALLRDPDGHLLLLLQ